MATTDPEFYQAPKFTPEPPPEPLPKQRGCFFYGCIIASVMAVLMVILVGVGAFLTYRFVGRLVDEYTSTTPRELPKVEMPPEQLKTLKERVDSFKEAVNTGTPTEPLVLTSDDLNALIAENPELKGIVYVKLEGNEVKGQLSLPLDKLNVGMVRGRYLNGEADFKASLSEGVLIVTLESIEVNGQKIPDEFLTEIRKQNLAKDTYKDEKTSEMIRKLESLEIKDGKIILKVRAKKSDSPKDKDASAAKKDVPIDVVPPKDGVPKDSAATDGAPKDSVPKNGTPKDSAPKGASEPAPKAEPAKTAAPKKRPRSRRNPSQPRPKRRLPSNTRRGERHATFHLAHEHVKLTTLLFRVEGER